MKAILLILIPNFIFAQIAYENLGLKTETLNIKEANDVLLVTQDYQKLDSCFLSYTVSFYHSSYLFDGLGMELHLLELKNETDCNKINNDQTNQEKIILSQNFDQSNLKVYELVPSNKLYFDPNILFQIMTNEIFTFDVSNSTLQINRNELQNGLEIIERIPSAFEIFKKPKVYLNIYNTGELIKKIEFNKNKIIYSTISNFVEEAKHLEIIIDNKISKPLKYNLELLN